MMRVINDKVFGELHYSYSWEKEETLTLKTESKQITVVVEAYPEQGILDIQRNQYMAYQHRKAEFLDKIPQVLLKYYRDNYDFISSTIDIPNQINKENISQPTPTMR